MERPTCRACLEAESEERPFALLGCGCTGDLALMHEDCAARWFTTRGTTRCEVCAQLTSRDVEAPREVEQPRDECEGDVPVRCAKPPRWVRYSCGCLGLACSVGLVVVVALLYKLDV